MPIRDGRDAKPERQMSCRRSIRGGNGCNGGIMSTSRRPFSLSGRLACGLLLVGALVALLAAPARAASPPPALYVGGDATLGSSYKVTSPLVGGQPSAALYVGGKLTGGSPANLSTVAQFIGSKGAVIPPWGQIMPDERIALLTQASQAAQQTGTVYQGLTYTDKKNVTFTQPITVSGNLTITGSGTYTFASVYVTGNVSITGNSAKFSFGALRVGGSLSVTGGNSAQWGPTYVAGDTTLSGSGQRNMTLLVTAGKITISGTQTIGGDGVGTNPRPVTILLTGQGKTVTYTATGGAYYGLLCNCYGAITHSGNGATIKGSVLCAGPFTATGSSTIAHDPNVGRLVLDATSPSVAISSPLDGSTVTTRTPVLSFSVSDEAGGSGIDAARTSVTVDGYAVTPTSGNELAQALLDGSHEIVVTAYDMAGNRSSATSTFAVTGDVTPPTTSAILDRPPNEAGWHNGQVIVTLSAFDDAHGSDVGATYYTIDGGPQQLFLGPFPVAGEGDHTVAYWSTDNAGNEERPRPSLALRIDSIPPAVSLAVSSPVDEVAGEHGENYVSYYNQPVLEFHASDVGSGLAEGSPEVADAGQVISGAVSGQALREPLIDGAHAVSVIAVDLAGNCSTSDPAAFVVAAPPFIVQSDTPYEGDVIGLYADDTARTGNPDGSSEGKTWKWTVRVDGREQLTFDEPVAFLALADKGPYDIELTVTDEATHAKCVTRQTISAGAQAPWVHAMNVEVLDGQPATLVARFLDPGWEQAHQATWTIDGINDPIGNTVTEDNFPAMDSGYVAGATPPLEKSHGDYQGHLTVADSMGDGTPVDFTIKPVSPDPDVDEETSGSDTITRPADSPVLRGGLVHLSYIQSADDVDIFEVKTPAGDLLPYGAEVLVTLRDVPADYDVALIQDLGEEVSASASLEGSSFASASVNSWLDAPVRRGADWEGLPVRRGADWADVPVRRGADYEGLPVRRGADWSDLPVRRGADLEGLPVRRGAPFIENAYVDSPVRRGADWEAIPVRRGAGWEDLPVRRGAGYVRPPLDTMYFTILSSSKASLDGYSFLNMGFTGLGSNTASGSTMTFAELGFSNEAMAGLRIADFSAHAGTGMETVYVKTEYANAHTYVAIKGANGACSTTQPYALQVETSLPLSLYDVLNEGEPEPRLVDAEHQTTDPTTLVTQPDQVGPLTLFVTQRERLAALYGDEATESVLSNLELACNDEDGLVRGEVLSVPSVIFNEWDEAPWMTSEANKVTEGIRGAIQQYLEQNPTVRYVVLVGSDEVIPQRRAPDQTVLANEGDYFKRSWLKAKGSVAASMYDCTVLTDDYYVDARPMPYNGRSLYAPDVAVSRLVESPAEINSTILQFLEAHGVLTGGSSVVTGQDFMADGAERVRVILAEADLVPEVDEADAWTAGFVRDGLLSAPRNVGSVNGHFVHYGGISADGWYRSLSGLDWMGEFLSSTEIADVTGYPNFLGKLVFTMGCHAGLSVPDDQTGVGDDYVGDPDPRLDIAQAMARRQGVLVGSTGYGYGDTEAVAGTEALIGAFADQMTTAFDADAAKGQPIGLALAEAKRQYLGSLSAITPYDEKSSIQFAMYGMPQYRLTCTTHPRVPSMGAVGVANPRQCGLGPWVPEHGLHPDCLGRGRAGPPVQRTAGRSEQEVDGALHHRGRGCPSHRRPADPASHGHQPRSGRRRPGQVRDRHWGYLHRSSRLQPRDLPLDV